MEFGIEKRAMPMNETRKREITAVIEQPNQARIRTLGGKEIYKYLGILEADIIKQEGVRKKN